MQHLNILYLSKKKTKIAILTISLQKWQHRNKICSSTPFFGGERHFIKGGQHSQFVPGMEQWAGNCESISNDKECEQTIFFSLGGWEWVSILGGAASPQGELHSFVSYLWRLPERFLYEDVIQTIFFFVLFWAFSRDSIFWGVVLFIL